MVDQPLELRDRSPHDIQARPPEVHVPYVDPEALRERHRVGDGHGPMTEQILMWLCHFVKASGWFRELAREQLGLDPGIRICLPVISSPSL